MANVNLTEVRLITAPLDRDYKNTIQFTDLSEQTTYFRNSTKYSATDCTYQREGGIIRYPAQYDTIMSCNYVMYKNSYYTNKWFYAFITNMEYKNDGVTEITIETDAIQTWLFDYTFRRTFVEREHVKDDTVGLHIQEEGLQIGDYIVEQHEQVGYDSDLYIVVGYTKTSDGEIARGNMYNGIYSGLAYWAFPNTSAGLESLNSWLNEFDEEGAAEAIQCMFMAPKSLVSPNDGGPVIGTTVTDKYEINTGTNYIGIGAQSPVVDGYTPKNKKLLTYPYRYLLVSNNSGVSVPYHLEDFEYSDITSQPQFKIEACLTPGCSIRMIPLNYKGIAENDEEGINLGKFPALNWTSDYFTNWLTQNSVNIGVGIASTAAMAAVGVAGAVAAPATGGASLAVAGAVVGGVSSIGHTMSEVYRASLTPPQSKGNTNCGDVVTASGKNDFHFYRMGIKKQYAEVIDQFFDLFGYKVNTVKIPNKNHRSSWWYTKTIDANIFGEIPQKDLQTIKDCYNRGITFWRSNRTVGDYSLPNDIVTGG